MVGQHCTAPTLCSVVSESVPHLKRGAIRDFFALLGESQESNPRWNKTDRIYTFGNGVVEFFPADDSAKLRGGRRDILFINEANNITYESFRELDIRTRLFTFLDWNPVSEFWAHEFLLKQPENAYIHSTYKDALGVLPREIVENIESNEARDPNWWNVYGLGLIGKIEGLVYPFFSLVEELPAGATHYCLDFGFSGDPAVLVKNVIIGEDLYSQELFYEWGLTNDAIARKMDMLRVRRQDEIIADCQEPKSIAEIAEKGYNIKPCEKGPGSVEYGHQKVRQFKQHWTTDSLNCIKEQRNFRYIRDKKQEFDIAGKPKYTEETTHVFSHGMDARRYGVATHVVTYSGPAPVAVSYM